MQAVDWILVADRTRAELLHALPGNLGPFPVLNSFIHAEGRLQPQERDTDGPGRLSTPGGGHTAVEPHEDRWRVEAQRFAHQIVGFLDQARHDRRCDRLIVIAPPPFLGVLRAAMPDVLQRCVLHEEGINLLQMSEDERQRRLAVIVAEARCEPTPAT
ncbi:MAG TPA: host attachment protein [Planctomycetaceae bacterium]|nr:host attachment protein [Planctomycetaceae bacterium]